MNQQEITDYGMNPFKPRYCSLCSNRPLEEQIIGRTLYRVCPHYVFKRPLSNDELRRKQEQAA